MNEVLLIINAILIGIILVTQIVSYPLLLVVKESNFRNYHTIYTKRISIVVLPLMLSELFITTYILIFDPNPNHVFAALMLLFIWLSTFFIQVPIHNIISKSKSTKLIKKLIISNWLRTSLWIIKFFFLISL
ncbi:MAG: hypothetical protein CMG13_02535 [Candidatus Marinimicrobia bacterium]|nr:hypothetical protein [Candidatus Neomarinimicrobiota bacterium]